MLPPEYSISVNFDARNHKSLEIYGKIGDNAYGIYELYKQNVYDHYGWSQLGNNKIEFRFESKEEAINWFIVVAKGKLVRKVVKTVITYE